MGAGCTAGPQAQFATDTYSYAKKESNSQVCMAMQRQQQHRHASTVRPAQGLSSTPVWVYVPKGAQQAASPNGA